jgi:hypothetical protein
MRGVLDGDRHAVERPERRPRRQRSAASAAMRRPCGSSSRQMALRAGLTLVQLRQRGFQHIDRRQLACSEAPRHLAGGQPVQIVRHRLLFGGFARGNALLDIALQDIGEAVEGAAERDAPGQLDESGLRRNAREAW